MDVHAPALLDRFQPDIGSPGLSLDVGSLATELVDPYHNVGLVEELLRLQEPKGQAVLSYYQFRRDYHDLEPPACQWCKPWRWRCSLLTPGSSGWAKEPQRRKSEDQELLHLPFSLVKWLE
jgi:hypothetical protein